MAGRFIASASTLVIAAWSSAGLAQSTTANVAEPPADNADKETTPATDDNDDHTIIVTATRRAESLQDVPLSITAFQQQELTEQGIVGYEGLARETPGVVLNKPTANFNNFTARGIATNGYGANLASTVAVYIDELPISANGNSTILDPTLFDVERVEFLRGPQGTLFGANSLAGAMRILTKSPDLDELQATGLVDFGITDGGGLRQRYNAMINIPLVADKLAFRGVGFYRHEDGWVDNIGTGKKNSNILESIGGRGILEWQPVDRLSLRVMALYENSTPKDSSLTNPDLGTYKRLSDRPDQFWGKLQSFNVTAEYDLDFAELTSSSTLSSFDQYFVVDLAGTFAQAFPFALDAYAYDDIFIQETRLASKGSGPFSWVIGGFYNYKRRDVDYNYRGSQEYLDDNGYTGLSDEYYSRYGAHYIWHELAGFGEVSYRFSPKFWLTGGLRYTHSDVQGFTEPGGYTSNYLTLAYYREIYNYVPTTVITVTDVAAATGLKVKANKLSYKLSASFKPVESLTAYATVSTGFRTPVANARAGSVSTVDPTDVVIPEGAKSDSLTNYEAGLKGVFLNGKLHANIAAYYIDWKDIQVQVNRLSDQVQFATNIGAAVSKGIEFELTAYPIERLKLNFNGSLNDAKVTEITESEAAMSGAVKGARLAFPRVQGSATIRYDFPIGSRIDAFGAFNVAYVGKYPGQFPNTPGYPDTPSATYDWTESYAVANLYGGTDFGRLKVDAYVENLLNGDAITYVHPEGFLDGRYGRQRPRTIGIRLGYDF